MAETVTYVMAIATSLAIIAVFFKYKDSNDESFVRLSMLFVFIFFVVPFWMVQGSGGFFYGTRTITSDNAGIFNSILSLNLFLAGFFLFELSRTFSKKDVKVKSLYKHLENEKENPSKVSKNGTILLLMLAIIVFSIYRYIAPESEELYDVRKGLAEGNHFIFFLSLVSTTLMLSAFFLCIKAKWNVLAGLFLILIFSGYLLSSPGRTALALIAMLGAIFITGISPRRFITLIPLAVAILFPVIINGKEVIYQIVTNNDFSYIFDSYNLSKIDGHSIFKNLAHPFVSMVLVDDLIEMTGMRFFYDYIHGFLFYFKVIGIDFGDSLTYYNTASLLSSDESIIPPGYIAFGYVQLWHVGVIVSGIFYRLSYVLFSMSSLFKSARSREMTFYASFICADTFYVGDIRQLVISFFLVVAVMHMVGLIAIQAPVFKGRADPR